MVTGPGPVLWLAGFPVSPLAPLSLAPGQKSPGDWAPPAGHITINISPPSPSPISGDKCPGRVLGWGWHHNWAHNPPGSVHAAVIMEISMKCTGKRDFIWLLFAFYFAAIHRLFILVTGLVSSGGCCLSQRCALKVDMLKIDNFDILFPVRPRRLSTRVDKSKSWDPRALAEVGLFDNPFLLSVNENILQTIDKFSLFRPDTQTTIAQIPMCSMQNNDQNMCE